MYQLLCVSRAGFTTHTLRSGASVTIGRSGDADIRIDDPSISRRHAQLSVGARGTLSIVDLESANGVYVDGRRIDAKQPTPVAVGEQINIGKVMLVVHDAQARAAHRVLGRADLFSHLDHRLHEAAETQLPFRVAAIIARDDVDSPELVEAITATLGENDRLASVQPREWMLVIDDVPAGRAMDTIRDVTSVLREEDVHATVGIATWPRDGRTGAALVAMATANATRKRPRAEHVIGERMTAVYALVDRIAASSLSVFVVGETGTGKELVAHRVHEQSPRAHRPFVKLDGRALSSELLEGELPRILAASEGGTVFFDAIGELSVALQPKLLHVIDAAAAHDVRFIAATHRRLEDPAEFRPELFFRLSGAVIEVPPLRERTDEIVPLAKVFLADAAARNRRDVPTLSPLSATILEHHPWPGNVRELQHAMERAAIVADGGVIEPIALSLDPGVGPAIPRRTDGPTAVTQVGPTGTRAPDRVVVIAALAAFAGNQSLAAEHLGVHRRTLMRWMDLMNIPRPRKSSG